MSDLPFFPSDAAMPMKPENVAALVAEWRAAAVARGCQEIVLPGWLDAASPLATALAECGFVAAETLHFHETAFARFRLEKAQRLMRTIMERGHIPADARLVTLGDVPAESVAEFITRHFPDDSRPVLERLRRGGVTGFTQRLSRVLLCGELVRGIILTTYQGAVAELDLVLVDESLRGGWANLWLKHSLREPMEQMGVQAVRYWVNAERNPDTMKAARLSGARELSRRVRLVLSLRPAD